MLHIKIYVLYNNTFIACDYHETQIQFSLMSIVSSQDIAYLIMVFAIVSTFPRNIIWMATYSSTHLWPNTNTSSQRI